MGFLSGMASLFHMDSAKKSAIRNEIDLVEAVEAHIHWKLRLQNYLDGNSNEQLDPSVVCRDDQCTLGKWIHGPAKAHFQQFDEFHQLLADHATFHSLAANVVRSVQENDPAAAHSLMKGEYARVSHKVVMSLTELNQMVND